MKVKTTPPKIIKTLASIQIKHYLYLVMFFSYSVAIPTQAKYLLQQHDTELIEAEQQKRAKAEQQYQVQFKARSDHDFLLTADYRYLLNKATAKNMAGVIVLHDCQSERKKYHALSVSIAEQGLHTLSLDFRGYGQSIAPGYSHLELKKSATDIISYQNEQAMLMSYWSEDLLAAYTFLRSKVDNSQGISIVASGCSAAYAVALAEQVHIKSMVLLTPKMSYADKERYKNLIDVPSYFISSAQHALSYATAKELFSWSGARHSKLQVYKGEKRNYQIMKTYKHLVNDIALWLKFTLR